MKPYVYHAKVIYVYDATTYEVIVDLGFHVHMKAKIKIKDLDTPGFHSLDTEEQKRAQFAKKIAVNSLLNKHVLIETEKGKPGIWNVSMFLPGSTKFENARVADSSTPLIDVRKYFEEMSDFGYDQNRVDIVYLEEGAE
jgi:hypothetical protein